MQNPFQKKEAKQNQGKGLVPGDDTRQWADAPTKSLRELPCRAHLFPLVILVIRARKGFFCVVAFSSKFSLFPCVTVCFWRSATATVAVMQAPPRQRADTKRAHIEALPLEMLVAALDKCRLVDAIRAAAVSRSMATASGIAITDRRAAAATRWAHGRVLSDDMSDALTAAILHDDARIIEDMWLAGVLPTTVGVRYRYYRERRSTRRGTTRRHVNQIISVHMSAPPPHGSGIEAVTLGLVYTALWTGAVDVFTFVAVARRANGQLVNRTQALWFVRIGADAMPIKAVPDVRPRRMGHLYAAIASTTTAPAVSVTANSRWSARSDDYEKPLTKAPLAVLIEVVRNTMVMCGRQSIDCDKGLPNQLADKLGVSVWQLERMVERAAGGRGLDHDAAVGILGAVASADESMGLLAGVHALVSMGWGTRHCATARCTDTETVVFRAHGARPSGRPAHYRPGSRPRGAGLWRHPCCAVGVVAGAFFQDFLSSRFSHNFPKRKNWKKRKKICGALTVCSQPQKKAGGESTTIWRASVALPDGDLFPFVFAARGC